jgi:polysaccharide biosynthesis acetyltransferase WcbI-like protein
MPKILARRRQNALYQPPFHGHPGLMSVVVAEGGVGAIAAEPETQQRWRLLGRLEKTAIGARRAGGVTTVRRREPAGCLLFGPYWQLRAGRYRLSFRCRPGKARLPKEPVIGIEVIAMNRVQLAWRDLTTLQLPDETGSLDFTVPPELGLGAGDEARLEFRFFHLGNADLAILAVDLQSVAGEETCPAQPRLWRMLGRLGKTSIGRRTAEGITIRRTERAGCVLDGGWPLLQLPAGHYRLALRCEAGPPRMADAPVLGVEIIARRRWQEGSRQSWDRLLRPSLAGSKQLAWRDFTAPELSNGSASLAFTVPSELALESGQDIVIDLRVLHLGNAALTIAAADLRQAVEGSTERPRQWRLSGRRAMGRKPRLQLPPGRYRLSFCSRVGQIGEPSRPALAVEVIARTRLLRIFPIAISSTLRARRDFTGEMLAAHRVSLDFDVPAELSCERTDGADFEFRFRRLRNADLAISTVELNEIDRVEVPLAPLLSRQRTRVLIVGNCQAQTIHEALVRSGEFDDRLDLKYHFVVLQQNLHELGKSEVENSDIVLVQDIRDWEHYPLKDHIRADTRIVKFPLLHFASLWPFDHYNGPGDKEAYEREWPNLTFLYHDGLLARLRKEIPDREERLLAYRTLSVGGIINFTRLHDFERRRLVAMDKQFGCEIGRFILENFRRRKLFYTTNHPNGQIIGKLMQYLLRQLEMDRGYRPNSSLDHLRRLQVPVHPKVAEALGVAWANERTKYLYGGEEITWETYVRRYIEHYG